MKKLIFVDNDSSNRANEDVDQIKNKLELGYAKNLPKEYVESIEIIPDFSHIPKDDAFKMLFDKNNCICTWSMYTASHYNSLYQMLGFLSTAGSSDIRDIVYIDGSGMLEEALSNALRNDMKSAMQILNAVETNHIIAFDDNYKPYRLRVELKGYFETPFKHEDVDLLSLLGDAYSTDKIFVSQRNGEHYPATSNGEVDTKNALTHKVDLDKYEEAGEINRCNIYVLKQNA